MMQQTSYLCPYCGVISVELVTPIMLHIEQDHPGKEIPSIQQLILDWERLGPLFGTMAAMMPEASDA